MRFQPETQEKINRFAREQSRNYLEDAEMTYLEKLSRKSGRTKEKISRQLTKFMSRSQQGLEAQNDMVLYMSDYMNDLIAQGLSEQEAYEKASQAMRFDSDSDLSADLNLHFQDYFASVDPAGHEAMGLFYAGFLFIGIPLGALLGYLTGGGWAGFFRGGWIDALVGGMVGLFVALGLGMAAHGLLIRTTKDRR